MAWATRPVAPSGGRLLAEADKAILDRVEFLSTIPAFHLRQTSVQSLGNGSGTTINMDTEDLDNYSGHSTSSNTSRYTVPSGCGGWWWLSGGCAFAGSATGRRGVWYRKNGSDVNGTEATMSAGDDTGVLATPARNVLMSLVTGDYVELTALQDSGGSLNTGITATQQPTFSGYLLIPAA